MTTHSDIDLHDLDYKLQSQLLTLANEPAAGDYLLVVWGSSSARIAAMDVI